MKHSVISWDCSFRNFFHLIDAFVAQEYDKNEFELIYVEQRSQKLADEYNHSFGLKSLFDRYIEVKDKINLRIVYLNDDSTYHLGICNNKGIELSNGEIISVMDGDVLLPSNFFSELDKCYDKNENSIINLYRHMVPHPIGVDVDDWRNGTIDFELCYKACPTHGCRLPNGVGNKGPLISAKKEHWKAVGGYDTHPVWNTAISRLGMDVTLRLELFLGVKSIVLPNCFCVHPYHNIEINRMDSVNLIKLNLQSQFIDWAVTTNTYNWKDRSEIIGFVCGTRSTSI